MRINKFLLSLLTLLTLLSISAAAQTAYEDVVYLKNGSIIHGTIIEQIPNESIKIQTKDRSVFVYKMDEILKLTKEETALPPGRMKGTRQVATRDNIKKNGFTNITEITFGKSFKPSSTTYTQNGYIYYDVISHFDEISNGPALGIQTINGYQFSHYLVAGAGIGMHLYSNLMLVPFFIDLRSNILQQRVSPFVDIQYGYSYTREQIFPGTTINSNSDDKGGVLLCPSIGVKFFVIPKMALNLSLGYRYQQLTLPNQYKSNWYDSNTKKENLRQFNLRFGFSF